MSQIFDPEAAAEEARRSGLWANTALGELIGISSGLFEAVGPHGSHTQTFTPLLPLSTAPGRARNLVPRRIGSSAWSPHADGA